MYYDEINSFIESNTGNIISDAVKLISVPSVSTDWNSIRKALEALFDMAEKHGLKAYPLLDNRIGIIEAGEGDETVGILAHIDVVPEGNIQDWTFPPYEGKHRDGFILGRGAMDDKGPIIAALYAMLAVKSMKRKMFKKVRLIIGTQEEVTWTDMEDYVKHYPLPDYGFTPDGEFPITNREKGYTDVTLNFMQNDHVEKSELVEIIGGENENSIPGYAYAIIRGDVDKLNAIIRSRQGAGMEGIQVEAQNGAIKISARGKAVHSSVPQKGINAIILLCRFLGSIPELSCSQNNLVRFILDYLDGDKYGKKIGLDINEKYMNGEYMDHTVISPTIVRTDKNGFSLNLNIRSAYGVEKSHIENALDSLKLKYKFDTDICNYLEPLYIEKTKPFLEIIANCYERVTGEPNDFILAHGTSYAKAMPNIVCWGPVFPGEMDYCHEVDERISVDSLKKACKIYALAIAELTLTEKSFAVE